MLTIFTLFSIFLTKRLIFRINLPYNEMGRYFDEKMDVVYHYQTVEVFILLLILCILAIILLILIILNKRIKGI